MKLTGEYKNHYLIIGTALAIIAVWYFFFKKKDTKESGYGMSSIDGDLPLIGNENGYGAPRFTRPKPTPTYPGSPFGRTEIACTEPKHWNGWTCVESGPEPKGNIAERTMISCPPGTIMSGGQCVPVGGGSSESNWWGSDWANAVTKDLNRWSKNN